jgi:hypothetical protein
LRNHFSIDLVKGCINASYRHETRATAGWRAARRAQGGAIDGVRYDCRRATARAAACFVRASAPKTRVALR